MEISQKEAVLFEKRTKNFSFFWLFVTQEQQEAPASRLSLFTVSATAIPGLPSKNTVGISLNPVVMQGCTGKSSVRTE
jgi:hypothetical protein